MMHVLQRAPLHEAEHRDEALGAAARVQAKVLRRADHHERLLALVVEGTHAHGEGRLVVRQLEALQRTQRRRVHHADAGRPLLAVGGHGRAAVVLVHVGDAVLLVEGLLLQLREGVVLRLQQDQAGGAGVGRQLPRRVGEVAC